MSEARLDKGYRTMKNKQLIELSNKMKTSDDRFDRFELCQSSIDTLIQSFHSLDDLPVIEIVLSQVVNDIRYCLDIVLEE